VRVLTTERAVLRPIEERDLGAVLAVLRTPEIARWWGTPSEDDVWGDPSVDTWVVEAGGELAGVVQAHEVLAPDYRSAGMDIALAARFQDRGLGPEVLRALARHLIDDRGHHRLTIDPRVANARAIAAYAKLGFRPVGVMRRYERSPDGVWHDGLLMDLLAEELR